IFVVIAALLLVPTMAWTATRPSRTVSASPSNVFTLRSDDDTRIDLDLDNVPVRDAVKRICDQAKQEYTVDDDVPDTSRVTVRAHDVRLSTALDLVTQASGIGWASETKDSKRTIHVGKSVRGSGIYGVYARQQVGDLLHNLDGLTNQRIQFAPNDFSYRL